MTENRLRFVVGFYAEAMSINAAACGMFFSDVKSRRLQFDLIFCYKIKFGIIAFDCNDLFILNTLSKTRGQPISYISHCALVIGYS